MENFFSSNQSQTESEKHDMEDEQCIYQEETDQDQKKQKITNFPENLVARSHMVAPWKGGTVLLFLLQI